ncbi:GNAT family N-acetyltransferase [Pelomonas sp. Root1444]|uniref:GNAT family N-acetyltransferase n=1 Tax=Pelomonas sp. Root1444 TaxID=1736464 RepID=UPI000702D1C3|nr:GNAT family N-acetyltransferase [Pelomonas sp. Root1444]KQY90734.1 GCN5 family acetyltransferase [Pelomonas sp. Root1444]
MNTAATPSTTDHTDHSDGAVVLLPFAKPHLQGALRLSQEMDWPYRLEDWAIALELGQGFVLQRGTEVIGTAAWWAYGTAHASAGMVIVSKSAQGRGYGARLMDALLAAAQPRTVVLNSTVEGMVLYERRGFARVGDIRQHQGIPEGGHRSSAGVVQATAPQHVDAIAQLDEHATGWSRRRMLNRLLQAGRGYVLLRGGQPCGYAVSRPFGRGHVIGPVVADGPADARALIETALADLGPVFARVDTPADSQLGEWLEAIGLRSVGDATTMVLGSRMPRQGPARVFALANQSFN